MTTMNKWAEGMALLGAANAVSDHVFARGNIDAIGKEMLLHARELRSKAMDIFAEVDALNEREAA